MAKKTRKTSARKSKVTINMGAKPLIEMNTLAQKPKTHVAIILDRSSSMSNIRQETVDAFNQQVRTIKERAVDQDVTVSLVTFSDYVDSPIIWNAPVSSLAELSPLSYYPNGWTALYDAVGSTINKLNELPDAHDPNTAFLMIIISDGEENRSQTYKANMLSSLIRLAQGSKRWTFTYVGANQDLSKVSEVLHIPIHNTLSFVASAAGMQGMQNQQNAGTNIYFANRAAGATCSTNFYDGSNVVTAHGGNQTTAAQSQLTTQPPVPAQDGNKQKTSASSSS